MYFKKKTSFLLYFEIKVLPDLPFKIVNKQHSCFWGSPDKWCPTSWSVMVDAGDDAIHQDRKKQDREGDLISEFWTEDMGTVGRWRT